MVFDVTDQTFQTEVVDRSRTTPVVVDLWAPWCGPCRVLGPILEKVVGETGGRVVLAKVNVDENPGLAQAFQAQSIPAVHAVVDGQLVPGFIGAQPEEVVRQFVTSLLPTEEDNEVERLVAAGDEASLRRALELDPDNEAAIVALARLLADRGDTTEALELLERIPETPETRQIAARIRTGGGSPEDIEVRLLALLDRVREDEEARRQFVDLLDVLGPGDPRTEHYRRQLASRLF